MTTIPWRLAAPFAFLVCACHKEEAPAEETHAEVAVQTVVVRAQSFTETVGAIGTVSARAGKSAILSAPTASRVANILVAQGQVVTRGQTVIELDAAPFRTATTGARAAVTAAQAAFDRAQRLVTAGISPRRELEQATAELASARADLEAAQRMEALAVIKAPISGVVLSLPATLGGAADPSQPLIEIADPTALDILLMVTPTDAGRVHGGAKVMLRAGQSESGEDIGVGTVIDVAAMVDSAARGVAVRVQAPTTRRPLRIGETVFGAIVVAVHGSALSVPVEALVPEGDGFKVFVVDAGNIAHATEVTVGARTATTAQITSGLTAGQRVVTYGAYGLDDSVKVTTPIAPKGGDSKEAKGGEPPGKS